ncbi:Ig domain-containing protein [Bacillota bacterium Meth-B3]
MTKRWLSLVLVLTLLSTLFTGAAMAAPVPKAVGPIVTFVREKTEFILEAGKTYQNFVLGHFLLAGNKLNNGSIANALTGVVKVDLETTTLAAGKTYVQGDTLYAEFTPAVTDTKLVVYTADAVDTTAYAIDMQKGSGAADKSSVIAVKATKPVDSMSTPIKWNGTAVTGIDHDKNTMVVGTLTDASNNSALTVELTPAQGTNGITITADKVVTWESNNEAVVKVTSIGSANDAATDPTKSTHYAKVEALKVGEATITAKAGGYARTLKITVNPVLPTSVSINALDASQVDSHVVDPSDAGKKLQAYPTQIGEAEQLAVTWAPTTTSDQTGSWRIVEAWDRFGMSVSAGTIATISSKGLLEGIKEGTVKVQFTSTAKKADGTPAVDTELYVIQPTTFTTVRPVVLTTDGKEVVIVKGEDPAPDVMGYKTPVNVTLSTATKGAEIYYTTDGKTPDKAAGIGKLYNNTPFAVSKDTTVKAIAYFGNATPGTLGADAATGQALKFRLAATALTATPATINLAGSQEAKVTVTLTAPEGTAELDKAVTATLETIATGAVISNTLNDDGTYTVKGLKAGKQKITFANVWGELNAVVTVTVTEPAVSGITVDQTSATVRKGERFTLKATVLPENVFDDAKGITYTSTNTTVATVTAGVVVGVNEGTATIRATSDKGGFYKDCVVTVTPASAKVATPVFTPESTTFTKPDVADRTVKVSCSTVGAAITYTVKDAADGSVVKTETLGADAALSYEVPVGKTYIITAQAKKVDMTDSESVTEIYTSAVAVTGIKITKGATSVDADGKVAITGVAEVAAPTLIWAPATTTNKNVTWTSSNTNVATVAKDGKITGVNAGEATITVKTVDGGFTDSVKAVVTEVKPETLVIKAGDSPLDTGAKIKEGETLQVTAVVKGAAGAAVNNDKVKWSTSPESKLAVTADGLLTAVKYDDATGADNSAYVTATTVANAADGHPVKTSVKVEIDRPTSTVQAPVLGLVPVAGNAETISDTLTTEREFTLTTTTANAEIRYTLDDTTPTKDSALYSTPLKLSKTTTIRAKAFKGTNVSAENATQQVTFALALAKIELNKTSAELEMGKTLELKATLLPIGVTGAVTWTSDMQAFATVDASTGKVTAVAPGKATITATSGSITATCEVTVVPAKVTSAKLSPAALTMSIGDEQDLGLVVTPADVLAHVNEVWTSSDEKVATVNAGKVTAVKAGTATITATVGGVKATAIVTVEADPTTIPAEPKKVPVYTPSTKDFAAVENSALTVELGKLTAGEGETYDQINYYYKVTVEGASGNPATFTALNPKFTVDNKGVVSMTIADVGNRTISDFGYTWRIAVRSNRSISGMDESRTINGNVLKIAEKPTAITYADSTPAAYEVPGTTGSVDMGTIGNRADFAATGVALTATVDATRTGDAPKGTVAGFSASVGSDGKVTLNIKDVATGVYNVFVTVSAEGCADVKTGTVAVTVKEAPVPAEKKISVDTKTPKFDAKPYKKRSVYVLNLTDGTATFSVPGYTATGWKSSKSKLLSIDANGVATLKKAGSTRITVSAKVDGKTVTQLVVIRKMAEQVKLQYKQGKKWIDFDGNPLTVKIGKKSKVLTRVVVVTPAKATILGGSWKIEDPTIATRGTRGYIVGLKEGKTSVTFTAHNGISVSCEFTVANQIKGAEEIIPETEVTEPVEETEEVVEVVEEAPVEEIPAA